MASPPQPDRFEVFCGDGSHGSTAKTTADDVGTLTTNGARNSTTIQTALAAGVNYQLEVPLDTLLKPDLYRTNALPAGAGFQIFVVIGNVTNCFV